MIFSLKKIGKPSSLALRLLAFTLVGFIVAPAFCQQVVVYPRPESSQDERTVYPVALLKLCEKKSGNQLILQPSSVHTQQGRSLMQLAQGKDLDIVWALSSIEREKRLLPIRIPIDRGLIGWRLLLIRGSDKPLFDTIETPQQLASLRAGQGHDWPDVDILAANEFKVTTSTSYEGLFDMLAFGHIHYFPRAVSEIWPEYNAHKNKGIEIENNLVIHYPSAFYFFVNRNDILLARSLENCLNDAIADGSFRELFNHYFSESIVQAGLNKRKIINLKNPILPKETPLDKPDYWYSPGEQ